MNPRKENQVTLTVYFSGTSHAIYDDSMLAAVLHEATVENESNLKIGFNGCGIDYGLTGVLFGRGLEKQCQSVVDQVIKLLKDGKRVKLNGYGHSRGGIGCLLLTKMLGKFDRDLVEINLALMDPVPGNLLLTSAIDFTHSTLTRQTLDISDCRNLNQVLTIYPNQPLADIAAHAPLLPKYPATCQVTEEIVPGCHAGAQFMYQGREGITGANSGSNITFILMSRFLAKLGTIFNFEKVKVAIDRQDETEKELLKAYHNAITIDKKVPLSRACHANPSATIKTKWPANYLTPLHQQLDEKYSDHIPVERNNKYAFSFSSPTIRPQKANIKPEQEISLENKINLFTAFIDDIYTKGMSKKSQRTTKGSLIKETSDELKKEKSLIPNESTLKDVLRNTLALCLQRDRNAFSPFSTTSSGLKAQELLNSKKYQPIAAMLLNGTDKKINYRDLRTFILGRNDESYFKSNHSQRLYQFFKRVKPEVSAKKENLFTNNMPFYLSK